MILEKKDKPKRDKTAPPQKAACWLTRVNLRPQRLCSWWVSGWEMLPLGASVFGTSFFGTSVFGTWNFWKFRGLFEKKRGSFVGSVNIGDGCPVADFIEKTTRMTQSMTAKKQKQHRLFPHVPWIKSSFFLGYIRIPEVSYCWWMKSGQPVEISSSIICKVFQRHPNGGWTFRISEPSTVAFADLSFSKCGLESLSFWGTQDKGNPHLHFCRMDTIAYVRKRSPLK